MPEDQIMNMSFTVSPPAAQFPELTMLAHISGPLADSFFK